MNDFICFMHYFCILWIFTQQMRLTYLWISRIFIRCWTLFINMMYRVPLWMWRHTSTSSLLLTHSLSPLCLPHLRVHRCVPLILPIYSTRALTIFVFLSFFKGGQPAGGKPVSTNEIKSASEEDSDNELELELADVDIPNPLKSVIMRLELAIIMSPLQVSPSPPRIASHHTTPLTFKRVCRSVLCALRAWQESRLVPLRLE